MANRARAVPENAPGSFFVDSTCIDCDTCRQLAPATFADHGEHSYVRVQPRNGEEERAAYRALVACPTASIGAANKSGVARAVSDFPMQLAPEVFYCGFNSEKSFGGNSYFTTLHEQERQYVNAWMRTNTVLDGLIDFDATVRDPVTLTNFMAAYFPGPNDWLHMNSLGYLAMANSIDLSLFTH